MFKLIFWLLTFFLANPSWAVETRMPNKIQINFSGPMGSTSTMFFEKTGKSYTITTHLNIPFYKFTYQSKGIIKNNQLITKKFTETRNNHLNSFAIFNFEQKIISYGKTNERKSIELIGDSYDLLSLPWQISFNPNLVLNTFQITNGKGLYLIDSHSQPIQSIKKSDEITTKHGAIKVDIYNLQSIQGNKTPIQFGYSPKYQYLPIYLKFNDHRFNIELIATNIEVDGKKIF